MFAEMSLLGTEWPVQNFFKGGTTYEEHVDGNHGSGSGSHVQRSFFRQ